MPHISLAFRGMWDTTAFPLQTLNPYPHVSWRDVEHVSLHPLTKILDRNAEYDPPVEVSSRPKGSEVEGSAVRSSGFSNAGVLTQALNPPFAMVIMTDPSKKPDEGSAPKPFPPPTPLSTSYKRPENILPAPIAHTNRDSEDYPFTAMESRMTSMASHPSAYWYSDGLAGLVS